MTNKVKKILGIALLTPFVLAVIYMLAFMIVEMGWKLLIIILVLISSCVGAYILGEIKE